jgi:hypothetical protein
MNGQFEPDEEYKRRQRGRNVAVGLLLLAMAVLFFLITLVRLGGA